MLLTLLSAAGLGLLLAYAVVIQRCLAAWNALPEWERPAGYHPRTFISVLIPARNEAPVIGQLLDSLRRQSYPKELFEVIVIDDHSSDDTAAFVEQHPMLNLRLLHLAAHIDPAEKILSYKKKALALGLEHACGTLVVTTDADCVVPPHWLACHAAFHETTDAWFVAAPVLFHREQNLLQRFQSLDFIGMMAVTGAGIQSRFLYMANGANLAFTKTLFQDIGGYMGNEQYASGDDIFLIQKAAARRPGKVAFLKSREAAVHSLPVPDWKSFVNQRLRWGTKNANYKDWRITAVLGLVFLLCWFILGMFLAVPWFGFYGLGLALALFAGKGLADYLFLSTAAGFFGRSRLMKDFWLLEVMHVLYIAAIGLLSLLIRQYEWKGRRVR
ncbi:MAG: glycosyltransferase [Phaeodactylibacter sp.]|nr:glycosyltransferase [Phaeodactylibacter sp.]